MLGLSQVSIYMSLPYRPTLVPNKKHDLGLEHPESENKQLRNPLLNILVINKIFKNLSCKDLIKCREINKLWNAEASRLLKRRLKHVNIPSNSIKNFLQVFTNSSDEFPVRKYLLDVMELDKMHAKLFHSLGSYDMITSLKISLPINEFSNFLSNVKFAPGLKYLYLNMICEKTVKGCPLISLNSGNCILLGKRSLPALSVISFRNGQPEKRLFGNYDSLLSTLVNAAENLVQLEFLSWTTSLARIFRECHLDSIISLRITGKAISETEILILGRKQLNKLKFLELFVDNSVRDDILKEFVNNLNVQDKSISIVEKE